MQGADPQQTLAWLGEGHHHGASGGLITPDGRPRKDRPRVLARGPGQQSDSAPSVASPGREAEITPVSPDFCLCPWPHLRDPEAMESQVHRWHIQEQMEEEQAKS